MMRRMIGFFFLILCLTLTVLVGGGWAEELLAPNCFGERCHEMSSLREPKDGHWNCWNTDGYYLWEESDTCHDLVATDFSATSFTIDMTSSARFDTVFFTDISMYKRICFELKGDDVERCVETEWLYKFLKMMQP